MDDPYYILTGCINLYVSKDQDFFISHVCLILLFSDETFHNVNSELRELPPVELSTLPLILKVCVDILVPDSY